MRPSTVAVSAALFLVVGCSDATGQPSAGDAIDVTVAGAGGRAVFEVEGVAAGGTVPGRYTCDGADETPPVVIEEVPDGVEALALVVDDPDAPRDRPFVHWVVYSVPPATTEIGDGDPSLTYGTNDAGTGSWFGPCPPKGDAAHTYRWRLFGLSEPIDLEAGLDWPALESRIRDSIVDETVVTATYARAPADG